MTELNDPAIYQTVLDGLETGVYIVDRNRRICFWNEGAEKITGYLRQNVVGHFLRDHLLTTSDASKDLDSDLDDPINLAFRDGKPSILKASILHNDGYRLPIVLRTNPIRNSRGKVIGAAESFERNRAAFETTRRRSSRADIDCLNLDEVTGVAAQSFMQTQLLENLISFAGHGISFAIILLQIDDMDRYRASRGPGVVFLIQRIVAQSIENCLRPTDLVGCWDNHRFLGILMDCKESEVALVGERTKRMVARSEMEWWGDKFSVTSSVGCAACREGDNMEALVARAEASLRESIVKGGNRVTALA
jgi:diguanylate cyclase (GGDEF)-like protein/PAS domain S-box-containing protein